MSKPSPFLFSLSAVLTVALPLAAQTGSPQGPGSGPQGGAREAMWFAPTTEDWQKPVLIEFQRTWADAVAVAEETGKPILICVNMDGEIASEHYAGVRYRQPDIAKLYEPYVCVIASTYRHTERDHDEQGNRIPCPRFGSVTCGEHIRIEPFLFEKFMDGRRISPRHIMVELDGTETYDVFYAFDTDSVFQKIEEGIAEREFEPRTIVRGDRSILERVASRDINDREAVEAAFLQGDEELQKQLLAAAREHIDKAPVDLLRMAVNSLNPDLAALAREALARADSVEAVDVIEDALRVPMAAEERQQLVASLKRLAKQSTRARTLAVVHDGLGQQGSVRVSEWKGGATYGAPPARTTVEARLDALETGTGAGDGSSRLAAAEAKLAMVLNPETAADLASGGREGARFRQLMFEDARRAALAAEQQGGFDVAERWRLDCVMALCAWYLGEPDRARDLARTAAPRIPADGLEQYGEMPAWNAVATLAIFADARHRDIVAKMRAKEDWPGEWLTDVSAAYTVLADHPLGTDVQVASHFDLLWFLGARARATRVLEQGLARFPASATLHDCLRSQVLRERGVDALLAVYDRMLAADDAAPELWWFAGYAATVAAEFHRRRGRFEPAIDSYAKAVARFDEAVTKQPDSAPNADHFAAIALAGKARIAFQAEDFERAVDDLLASFARCPTAAGTLDGLSLSAVDTARLLQARLTSLGKRDLAARVAAGLDALPPAAFELPEFERDPDKAPSPDVPESGRRRRGR